MDARAYIPDSLFLLPDSAPSLREVHSKDLSLEERPAGYQLVGRVTAYQGYDG